jgi:hypothetical protein
MDCPLIKSQIDENLLLAIEKGFDYGAGGNDQRPTI